jgi:DNA-binding GntR family transcriptional regulator
VPIVSSPLAIGRLILSEQSLVQQHGVSRGTAGRAVKILRKDVPP